MKTNRNNHMKKALVIVFLFTNCLMLQAQDAVNFVFSGGIENTQLKTTMERQISNLMTAINRAETYNADINYSGIYIDNLASKSIDQMWKNVHMRTRENNIRGVCLRVNSSRGTLTGYQVRSIAVRMVPVVADYDENMNQEICIDFDRYGMITDFNLTSGINGYETILSECERLYDIDKCHQILHWMAQFRNAYCQKDIAFMENVFSEDALIITGKVVRRVAYSYETPNVQYIVMDKQKYMENLRRVFKRNAYVNVQFDDIEISRHGVNPNIYGVTLVQRWNSSTYSDIGWLFVIWDFTDEFNPKILVRTWQDKKDFTRGQVLSLDDFDGLTDE